MLISKPGIVQKNNKESSADELKLKMVGRIKTTVIYHTGSGEDRKRHAAIETKELFSYDVQLASFGGTAASGEHSFPFSMTFPEGLPPSLKVGKETRAEGTIEIAWGSSQPRLNCSACFPPCAWQRAGGLR